MKHLPTRTHEQAGRRTREPGLALVGRGDGSRQLLGFGEERLDVQRTREYPEASILVPGPLLHWAVPVELEAVTVRVAQIERFADSVIRGSLERDARLDEAPERVRERLAIGVADRGVEEPRVTRRRRRSAAGLPGVEPDVVVVATSRDEHRLVAVPRLLLEAEDADVEVERPLDVGDLEVDMADVHARVDWFGRHRQRLRPRRRCTWTVRSHFGRLGADYRRRSASATRVAWVTE